MSLNERMPLLKDLTSLTAGEDEILDETNLLYSLKYQFSYQVISEFLIEFCNFNNLDIDKNLIILEGFVDKSLLEDLDTNKRTENHISSFRSVIFEIDGSNYSTKDFMEDINLVVQNCTKGSFIEKIRLVKDKYFIIFVKENILDKTDVIYEIEEYNKKKKKTEVYEVGFEE